MGQTFRRHFAGYQAKRSVSVASAEGGDDATGTLAVHNSPAAAVVVSPSADGPGTGRRAARSRRAKDSRVHRERCSPRRSASTGSVLFWFRLWFRALSNVDHALNFLGRQCWKFIKLFRGKYDLPAGIAFVLIVGILVASPIHKAGQYSSSVQPLRAFEKECVKLTLPLKNIFVFNVSPYIDSLSKRDAGGYRSTLEHDAHGLPAAKINVLWASLFPFDFIALEKFVEGVCNVILNFSRKPMNYGVSRSLARVFELNVDGIRTIFGKLDPSSVSQKVGSQLPLLGVLHCAQLISGN